MLIKEKKTSVIMLKKGKSLNEKKDWIKFYKKGLKVEKKSNIGGKKMKKRKIKNIREKNFDQIAKNKTKKNIHKMP